MELKKTTAADYCQRINKVLNYIHQRLDQDVSLDQLAAHACFSSFHFHRIFTGMTGESVKSYIRRLKLERAAVRLIETDNPVTFIAFDSGFETHEAFSRAFKRQFRVSPTQYRKNDRKTTGAPDGAISIPQPAETTMKAKIIKLEETEVIYVHHTGPYNLCGAAWEKLCGWAGPRGLFQPGVQFMGLSYDDPEVTAPEQIRYDACLTVTGPVEVEGEIECQKVSGGPYAMTTHFGPYHNLSKTYSELCGVWVPQNGFEIADKPSVEIYQNSPEDTDPEDLITDVYIPLEEK